jgi:hypothetical protein
MNDLINISRLRERLPEIKAAYQSARPFRYVMFENFFPEEVAEQIHAQYPSIKDGQWNGTTYVDQKNKFQQTQFEKGSVVHQAFEELNAPAFLRWLQEVTGMEDELLIIFIRQPNFTGD